MIFPWYSFKTSCGYPQEGSWAGRRTFLHPFRPYTQGAAVGGADPESELGKEKETLVYDPSIHDLQHE